MHRASRLPLVGVGLTVALWFAALALSAGVGAQERRQADRPRGEAAQVAEVTLTPSRGSGVRGSATLKGVAGGVKVTIPLKTITAQKDGTGSATTTIKDVSLAQLFREDRERFILLHAEAKKGEGVPPGIACADLAPLADTGGIRPAPLFLAGAISVLGVAAGLFILQRRIGAAS